MKAWRSEDRYKTSRHVNIQIKIIYLSKKKNQNYLYAWPKLFSKVKKSIYFAIKIYGGSDFVVLPWDDRKTWQWKKDSTVGLFLFMFESATY